MKSRIDVMPVSGSIGAEISGVNLAGDLSDVEVGVLREALLEHLVIFFRDQVLTPGQHLTLARRFGKVVKYPLMRGLPAHSEIIPVVKLEHETVNFGGLWHSDTTYLKAPPMGSLLYARELPPFGGDTLFANMYLAYDALSEGMKKILSELRAVNSSAKAAAAVTREDRLRTSASKDATRELIAVHPVVRRHPETGRKILYVNPAHTVRFEHMTIDESAPLLAYLHFVQTWPEFTCRFQWRPGSLAFWDNRATQHNPVNDYHGHKRVMHRITLAGDPPLR
jgi:taurine dioxygenase